MLDVRAIDLSYGASLCLRGVSLAVEPGKVTCVLGRNGVGKSSLLRAVMGLERVGAGSIAWEGRDITRLGPAERARAGIGYVPQVGIINPGEFSPGNSIEAVVWVAVGGRGTLVGAVLGAFSVNALKTWLTSAAPDLWLFVLGGLFVAVTLFLPRGLVGLFDRRGKGRAA